MQIQVGISLALGAGVVVGLATIAWCEWQFRRGRGEVYRRTIPGLVLIVLATVISLAGSVAPGSGRRRGLP